MFPLTAKTREINGLTFRTVESYFASGVKGFGVVFGLLGINVFFIFKSTFYFPILLLAVSAFILGLKCTYVIDFNT